MNSESTSKYKKICVYLSEEEYFKFKTEALKRFLWERGFTAMAVREAITMWISYEELFLDDIDLIYKIARKKYPGLDNRELIKMVMKESVNNWITENHELVN